MNKAFYQLEKTKQDKIINAALKEFTESGFEKASTNKIVKKAGIGKGTLFYYFNNKKDLFLFLIEYCLKIIRESFFNRIDTTERDLIERWKKVSFLKLDYLKRYPNAMNFITRAAVQEEEHLNDELKKQIAKLQVDAEEMLYRNIDYSLFRKDVDTERAIKLLQWVISGYEQEMRLHFKQVDMTGAIDYTPYFDEFFDYLDTLKKVFYSSEEDEK